MKQFIYTLWSKFLVWFSKLTIVKSVHLHLPVIVYDDTTFKVTGNDILQIMELIQPGDVLLRGYDKYVDGKFIPDPKKYSHAGLYVGDNSIIHATSPAVNKTSIIDFCNADRVMVLRPVYGATNAIQKAETLIGVPYDFNYNSDIGKLYCFELVANCYDFAELPTYVVKKVFGLIKRDCYLAKSIYESEFFEIVFEKN